MRFAPHWARVSLNEAGEPDPDGPFVAFGWSFSDVAEARQMATERAQRLRSFVEDPVERGEHEPLPDYYPTDGSVLREVVLEEGAADGVRWAITRNSYGAQVLNVEGLAILDVDIPVRQVIKEPTGFWGRLFGRPQVHRVPADPEDVLAPLRSALAASPFGGVIYRTAGGFRVVVQSEVLHWNDPRFVELLRTTASDRLYAELCRRQECCRARLTPKPWRVGSGCPDYGSVPMPWAPSSARTWDAWLATYKANSQGFDVAHRVETFGSVSVAPALQAVIRLHDRCVGTLPLA